MDCLALYLIHQPYGDVHSTWRARQELYREGKIKAIVGSNFQPDRVTALIVHNKVVPAVNQVEIHLFNQQIGTQKFLLENNVQIQLWGPFVEGKNNLFHKTMQLERW